MRFISVVIAVLVLCSAQMAWCEDPSDRAWRISLDASVQYGQVDGYVQTPSGGEPGTSSRKRPKFGEIGIDNATIYDVRAIGGWHNEELALEAQFIRRSGDDTLDQTLVSQGNTFPAGTAVNGDVQLDWYLLSYRHRFMLGDQREWTLWPSVGVALFNFHYTLDSAGPESVDRHYIKAAPELGLETEWRPGGGRFSVDLQLLGTPPFAPPFPLIFMEALTAKYRLLDGVSIRGGVSFEQIYYEDNQTLPNRVRADFGPMLLVGLEWKM